MRIWLMTVSNSNMLFNGEHLRFYVTRVVH